MLKDTFKLHSYYGGQLWPSKAWHFLEHQNFKNLGSSPGSAPTRLVSPSSWRQRLATATRRGWPRRRLSGSIRRWTWVIWLWRKRF